MRARLAAFKRRKFVRDTLVLQLGNVLQSGTYFITSVLTARLLGRLELGRWSTSRELYMFVYFMVSMGLTNACVSRYSQAKGAGDEDAAVESLAALLKLGLLMASLVAALGFFLAPWAASHFYDDRSVGHVTAILCFGSLGEVLRSLTLAVLNGTRQMKRYVMFDGVTNVLRVGLVGTALFVSRTSEAVAWAFLSHAVLSGLLGLVTYQRTRALDPRLAPPPLGRVFAAVPSARLSDIFGLSALLALSKAMNTVVPRLGPILIPWLAVDATTGFKANGAYQVGMVLTMVLSGGVGAIANNLLPTLGLKMGGSDVSIAELGKTLRRLSLYSGGLTVAATLVSLPIMWVVIHLFYGSEYVDSFEYYCLLVTGNLFIGFAVIVEPFYIYARRMHIHVAQSLVYATLAIAGIATATREYGPKGAALAGGLCKVFVLFHLVYIWWFFRRSRRDLPPQAPDESHQG